MTTLPDWPDEDRAEAALERLRAVIAATPSPAECDLLPYELRMVAAASHGLTNREIAEVYGVGFETVKDGMRGASRKLAAKTRAHAVALALRRGLIS